MRTILKPWGSLALGTATLMLAACGGHGPNSYLMPKDAVASKLTGAEREFNFLGSQKRTIKSVARNGDTIRIRLSSGNGGMQSAYCSAIVEAIDDDWTRVTPDCTDKNSAIEETVAQINEMQVDEFVIAVLYDKPIDEAMVKKRTSAVAIDNLGAMGKEVRAEVDKAAADAAYYNDSWADSGSGSDWGN